MLQLLSLRTWLKKLAQFGLRLILPFFTAHWGTLDLINWRHLPWITFGVLDHSLYES